MLARSRSIGLATLALVGCGRVSYARDAAPPLDARFEIDTPREDAGLDAFAVVVPDAGLDVGFDPGTDATSDVGSDAGPDAPTPREIVCGAGSTIACLSFDADPPSPWESWHTLDDGTIQRRLDDAGFRGGALELSIPASATSSGAGIRMPLDGASFRGGLYVSAFMRVSRPAVSGFLVLMESNNGLGGVDQRKVSVDSNGLNAHQLVVVGGASVSGAAFPLDRWVCVRMAITDALAESEVDGEPLTSPLPFDVGTFVGVNLGGYSQRDAATIVIDDVLVSTTPVDCLPL
ncbi:MAG: hypothetical protein J0L92_03370 [Deltaproteobacteria bacterium]|nr:hypothetical protein [Deltaproteobacteria bacterium]